MRRPIFFQLLTPTLAIVVGAIAASSALTAWIAVADARRAERQSLRRTVEAISTANFPLNDPVLARMAGLSGADFVVLENNQPIASTISIPSGALDNIPPRSAFNPDERGARIEIDSRAYLADRIQLPPRSTESTPTYLVVLYPEQQWSAASRAALMPPLLVGAAAAGVVTIVATLLARRLVRPIQGLGRHAAVIAAGKFVEFPTPERDDEIADLTLAINAMTRRLSSLEAEVGANERLRALGQMSGGIAHQMRNSATGARMALDLHREECPLSAESESLSVAHSQFLLIENYLQRFLTLGASRAINPERIELASFIADTVSLVAPAMAHAKIELVWAPSEESVFVHADPEALRDVLINLILNAIHAAEANGAASQSMGLRGRVEIDLSCAENQARIRISDSGAGPPPEIAEHMFEPFITGKADGAGLGLAVAQELVKSHGGDLGWDRAEGVTSFWIVLNRCE